MLVLDRPFLRGPKCSWTLGFILFLPSSPTRAHDNCPLSYLPSLSLTRKLWKETCVPRIHRDRKEIGGCQGLGVGVVEGTRDYFLTLTVSVWESGNISAINDGDGCPTLSL